MLSILAHRGHWKALEEKNSLAAFERALLGGHGIEADVRDSANRLVIAHDPAPPDALPLETLLALHARVADATPLALNIKADGLGAPLKTMLQRQAVKNYFCFDMSVPEMLSYRRAGLSFFTRESEFEAAPALYADAAGVWMDMFQGDWIKPADIAKHLAAGKQAALVSPELHRRPHLPFWAGLRASPLASDPRVLLCTDFPDEAREYFHG